MLIPLLVLAGIAMTASNASANALLLASAPTPLRGEAIALYMLAMRGGVAVGGLLTGAVVSLIGVRSALFVNGALAVFAHAAIARSWRHVAPASLDPPAEGGGPAVPSVRLANQ